MVYNDLNKSHINKNKLNCIICSVDIMEFSQKHEYADQVKYIRNTRVFGIYLYLIINSENDIANEKLST